MGQSYNINFINMRIFVLLFSFFFLTSCFEIKESVKIYKDGSGSFSFALDFSAIKDKLHSSKESIEKGIRDRNESNNPLAKKDIPDNPFVDLDTVFDRVVERLELIEGITNIEKTIDNDQFIFAVKFDFESIDLLNIALRRDHYDRYFYNRGLFIKPSNSWFMGFLNAVLEEEKEKLAKQKAFISRFYSQISYICTIETNIKFKKRSNEAFEMSEDKLKLVLETSLDKLINKEVDSSLQVKIK